MSIDSATSDNDIWSLIRNILSSWMLAGGASGEGSESSICGKDAWCGTILILYSPEFEGLSMLTIRQVPPLTEWHMALWFGQSYF